MAAYYDELLELCGFEGDDIENERSRIDKMFERMGIGPEDIEPAKSWVSENHDISLRGVRKLLGAWLKELIDLVNAKDEGKKVVYLGFPPILTTGLMLAVSSDDLFVTAPDVVLDHTMGQIFNKLSPILETAEKGGLPPGHGMCSLLQAKLGGILNGMIPAPDLSIASSFYCDIASKTDDLITSKFGTPTAYIDGVMDSKWGEYPDYLPERVRYLGAQIDQTMKKAEKVLGITLAPDALEKSEEGSEEFVNNLKRVFELMQADPVPISVAELELLEALSGASTGRGIMEGAMALEILIEELEERVKKGIGVTEKGAPRVMTWVGHCTDARITRVVEDAGLAVPLTLTLCWVAGPASEPKGKYSTPGEIVANNELAMGIYHGTEGSIRAFEVGVDVMDLDGFVMNYLFNCRPDATLSGTAKKHLEEKTGLPVLEMGIDCFDNRIISADSLRTKVETFAEMLKAKKKSAK